MAASPQIKNASWFTHPNLRALMRVIGGETGKSRYVGGAVRDTLLDLPVKDIDVATQHSPQTIIELLATAHIKAVPTGIDHGTVTAILPDMQVEITTLRRDVATDGRRAVVAFTDDWREDAARRDFTINALYADPITGQIFDCFDGSTDLANRHIRFIGSANDRIREDYLRILRYFRFYARFGANSADQDALDACAANTAGLTQISAERIASELLALLKTNSPLPAVRLMHDTGVWSAVLPEMAPNGIKALRRLLDREARFGVGAEPLTRLAALLPASKAVANSVADRLKLSNAQRKSFEHLLHADAVPARKLAYHLGTATALQVLLLHATDPQLDDGIVQLHDWTPPAFPLRGQDLIDRGLPAGPQVSEALRAIEVQWIAEAFPAADHLDVIVRDVLANSSLPSLRAQRGNDDNDAMDPASNPH